jgi:hypothetical protein
MKLLLIFAVVAAACGAAVAQGMSAAPVSSQTVGSNALPPTIGLEGVHTDPAFPSRHTGTILAVDKDRRLMMIELPDKSHETFIVDPKFRARADKDTALAGKKDLSLNDYKRGQLVTVTYRANDKTALEIRLRRPKD